MFFRSKPEAAASNQPASAEMPPIVPLPDLTPSPASLSEAGASPVDDEQKKRALAARRSTAAFGQVMALMMRSPSHQKVTVGDLRSVVAPLVMAGQYALAGKKFSDGGFARPVAAILWAQVSEAVDQRLSGIASGPLQLARAEISSGNIIWIVDVLGDGAAIQSTISRLGETQWKGQVVKVRTVGPDQTAQLRTLGPF